MAALGLRGLVQAFLVAASGGYSSLQCSGFSLRGLCLCRAQAIGAWASVIVLHGLSSWGSQALELRSAVVASGLSCSMAYGIFQDQGMNPCPPRWQMNSYPLNHQGSPLSPQFQAKEHICSVISCQLLGHGTASGNVAAKLII